ncbi:MAG: DUF2277 domain-containing protein [Ktedonobacterales bacterium]
MCRSIKPLFNFEPPATDDEIHAAAVQYVRKVSGFARPSKANEAAFQMAIEEITAASRRLRAALETNAPPTDRAEEAARAHARATRRFAPATSPRVAPALPE